MTENLALECRGLGKRYGRKWGLRECSFGLPVGRVAALVGPNGAGKSTLLRMAAGITRPTEGSVTVFGGSPQHQTVDVLARVAYLDQERPLYSMFKVEEMLEFGRRLNPVWDHAAARSYLSELSIPFGGKVGKLSVGQQAQVALAMCLAKRPDLLLLDEPVAALDPVAREGVMRVLLSAVADAGTTVLFSSHALADLVGVCDYLVILSASRVHVADDLEYVLASHRLLVSATDPARDLPAGVSVVSSRRTGRQVDHLVRVETPVDDSGWRVVEPTLDEIVIGYLRESYPETEAFRR